LGTSFELRHETKARGDARDTSGDTSKARRDLGYEPQHTLEEGLAAQVDASLVRTR
jgi:nucleoside-diphosphate-sugar epimerase